MDITVNTFIG